jgi:UDP-N-acetylmuramate dehydrogenase
MIKIEKDYPLKNHNTLGIDARARYFSRAESLEQIRELLLEHRECFPFLIIGEGSNILFTGDFNGIVIQPAIKGIDILENDLEHCIIEVGAGENWDSLVAWAVEKNLGGIENLSLIPGSAGSSPIQNIGAYGVEVKDVILSVRYLDLETFQIVTIQNPECRFGYRSSIFKTHLKNRVIITSVIFRLNHHPVYNTSYGNLLQEVERSGELSLRSVRNAVIDIRRSKLPDPDVIGNAGSFFKNPVVESSLAHKLREENENMPIYKVSDELVKIPAGWLIEQCGWKGKREGKAGVHDKQALVLVNHGGATGAEIHRLALRVSDSVFERFGIRLEPEVNII